MNPYNALKGAFRDLVDAVGGNVRAARVSRADGARLSRYGAIHEAMHAPIDVIADLEQECGDPIVTRSLAELAGFNLVPKCKADASADFTKHLGDVAKEAGELMAALGIAVGDGQVTAQEAVASLKEVREVQERLACLEQDLARVAASAPISIRRA